MRPQRPTAPAAVLWNISMGNYSALFLRTKITRSAQLFVINKKKQHSSCNNVHKSVGTTFLAAVHSSIKRRRRRKKNMYQKLKEEQKQREKKSHEIVYILIVECVDTFFMIFCVSYAYAAVATTTKNGFKAHTPKKRRKKLSRAQDSTSFLRFKKEKSLNSLKNSHRQMCTSKWAP